MRLLIENDKIAKAFKNMFQTLLNKPKKNLLSEECDMAEQDIEWSSTEKVEAGLEMLKSRKTPRENYILTECLKNEREKLIKQLHKLVDKIWDTNNHSMERLCIRSGV